MPDPLMTALSLRTALISRAQAWSPTTRGLLWTTGSGLLFTMLNDGIRNTEPFYLGMVTVVHHEFHDG